VQTIDCVGALCECARCVCVSLSLRSRARGLSCVNLFVFSDSLFARMTRNVLVFGGALAPHLLLVKTEDLKDQFFWIFGCEIFVFFKERQYFVCCSRGDYP